MIGRNKGISVLTINYEMMSENWKEIPGSFPSFIHIHKDAHTYTHIDTYTQVYSSAILINSPNCELFSI